ncbi:PREDICTED: insulin-degrading enzyme-like isoform X1 [Cyphomyrmex costatus]|uniref:insulin-degrading enzyme-like isoform X1 n=2 Tax=Cyphomyrmex costatus TaxID=456900 RepID=UPI0008523404|nr:PREDICTED: insulin-degrading enzyme-like isoform X1 [Cyphomyrmex costatus]
MFVTCALKSCVPLVSAQSRLVFRNQIAKSASVTNMSTRVEMRYDDIIKSQSDDRLYRGLVLSNKMKVLLISDPTTDKSAAAMNINVGYMSDPDDLPGLAHFCEHMLFLGTKKYPKENDYNIYLSQNGGMSNASTNLDHTTYYFDVTPEKLEGALDRFAQFFIAPLFTENLTELELNAINSEHEKNVANDSWRCDYLDKSSARGHPFSKFGTGNRETLDIIPKQKDINVRNELLEFYEKYYSANIMSLSILSKESLDELENMVVDLFCEVRNKEIEVPIWPEHPFKDEHFRTIWYIVPIKDIRNLGISFPLPDMRQHYRSAPEHYVSHLLGHEGKGSLLSALKSKGWCNSLVSGKRPAARGFSIFNIIVDLTEEGIKHIEDVVLRVFQYINMLKLKGPIRWIYDEYRDIANMNFRFKEKSSPRNYVNLTVQALQEFPMNEILCAECIYPEWRPDLIEEIMTYLTPQNVRIHVVGKAYEDIADETERWYGIKYKKMKISEETMEMWSSAVFNDDLKLPPKNKFIATTFDIKPQTNIEKFPIILEDTSFVRLWYKKDDEFLVPRARMIFDFFSPFAFLDPLNCNLTYMFIKLFRDSLNEYTYAADLAGLQWELGNSEYGITLSISGYDNKQHVLLEKLMDRMINFKVDPKRFEILKEKYIRNLKNFAAEQPYQHAVYYLVALLAEQSWLKEELLEATAYLSVEGLQKFIPQLFSKVHVECLIHGNVTITEATDILKLIESKLTTGVPNIIPLLEKQLLLSREIKLEDGCHFLFEAENNLHKSSCTMVYYPTGLQSTESNMLLELLAQIIAEPCFNTLRTKEQLGYIVFSGIRRTSGTQGLRIIVQSDKHPQYVEKRINLFLDYMLNRISTLTEEQFEKYKKALATLRLEKPKRLTARCALYWTEIVNQQYNFDRVNIEVAYLKTISLQQLLNFFKENVHSKTRHKLSVHVISTATSTENNSLDNTADKTADLSIDKEVKKIDDITSFKNSQSLYPLLKPLEKYFLRKGVRSSKL